MAHSRTSTNPALQFTGWVIKETSSTNRLKKIADIFSFATSGAMLAMFVMMAAQLAVSALFPAVGVLMLFKGMLTAYLAFKDQKIDSAARKTKTALIIAGTLFAVTGVVLAMGLLGPVFHLIPPLFFLGSMAMDLRNHLLPEKLSTTDITSVSTQTNKKIKKNIGTGIHLAMMAAVVLSFALPPFLPAVAGTLMLAGGIIGAIAAIGSMAMTVRQYYTSRRRHGHGKAGDADERLTPKPATKGSTSHMRKLLCCLPCFSPYTDDDYTDEEASHLNPAAATTPFTDTDEQTAGISGSPSPRKGL